jgi:hypothetical protein
LENPFPFLLSDAAEHGEGLTFLLPLKLIQPVEHFLFRFISDTAGVVKYEVRRVGGVHLRVALHEKRAGNLLRIVGVHLTSERLDVKSLH